MGVHVSVSDQSPDEGVVGRGPTDPWEGWKGGGPRLAAQGLVGGG